MRRLGVATLLLALVAALAGCGKHASLSTTDALTQAKQHLDTTSGVHVTLATSDLPSGVKAPTKADGVLTRAPAFQGTVSLRILGISANVAVIAVDGKVWAKIPFTSGYQQIDPASYGVPDPAKLLDPDGGISSILTATTDVKAGSSQRGGADHKQILTEYDGAVPGSAVAAIIPGATGDFTAAYTIDDTGALSQAVLTGHFAGDGNPAFTYTVSVSDYGTSQAITAP